MATSRYPRPLKATQNFISAQPPGRQLLSGSPSPASGAASVPGRRASVELRAFPERRSPGPLAHKGEDRTPPQGEGTCKEQQNPRRSNSLDCLSDPDCYMNSLWPRVTSTNMTGDSENHFQTFSHKRSNSCSSTDRLNKTATTHQTTRNGQVCVHTRMSVEGLNQEISAVLEGKCFETHYHPDGHVAPIRDLIGQLSVGMQTPPRISTSHSSPSSLSPSPYPPASSPYPTLSSPSQVTPTLIFTQIDYLGTSPASYCKERESPSNQNRERESPANQNRERESPGTPDYSLNSLHPPSPKPSFAREPPDGAERCTIRQDTLFNSEDFIPSGPDKSKGNIVFRGTVFAPLLPTPSLQSVPISAASPINSL